MALIRPVSRPLNAIEVISKDDGALDLDKSDFAAYQKTGDVGKLKFLENKKPTVFLCNFKFSKAHATEVKNELLAEGGNGKTKFGYGSALFAVAKYALKDIQNPEGVAEESKWIFKKGEDGLAHDELLVELDSVGVLNSIFAMYSELVINGAAANIKN